jgi:hypothetical protein
VPAGLLLMAAWTLVPAGTRTPVQEGTASAGAVVVVGVAVVVDGSVVVVGALMVVVGSCTSTKTVAESVRTPPSFSVIFARIVCLPSAGNHGLAMPSPAVPLKSKGRELSKLCIEPSRAKATLAIVPLDGTKTYMGLFRDCPTSATACERSGEWLTSSPKLDDWSSDRTGPMIIDRNTNMRKQAEILPMERRRVSLRNR